MAATAWSSRTRAAAAAGLLAVGALALAGAGARAGTSVDFYQFWGVPAARALADGALPPPWEDPAPTRRVLDRYFAGLADPELARLQAERHAHFEPFGSPLLYLAFAPLPRDYRTALALFRALQLAAFGAGVAGLVWLCGRGAAAAGLAVALLALAYRPFGDDLYTGNVNALQLAGLVGGIAALARPAPRLGAAGATLAGLAVLALFKANAALVVVALALCAARRWPPRTTAFAVGVAVGVGAAAALAASLYFGSALAWPDWARFAFLDDPRRLQDYAVARGNASTPRWLAERFGLDPLLAAGGVAAALAGSLALAAPGPGTVLVRARRVLARWQAAPLDAAGVAVVVTLAVLPLVWFHYFVLALIPGLALALGPRRARAARALALLALAVYSAAWLPLARRAGVYPWLPGLWSFTWIGLWLAWLADARAAATADAGRPEG